MLREAIERAGQNEQPAARVRAGHQKQVIVGIVIVIAVGVVAASTLRSGAGVSIATYPSIWHYGEVTDQMTAKPIYTAQLGSEDGSVALLLRSHPREGFSIRLLSKESTGFLSGVDVRKDDDPDLARWVFVADEIGDPGWPFRDIMNSKRLAVELKFSSGTRIAVFHTEGLDLDKLGLHQLKLDNEHDAQDKASLHWQYSRVNDAALGGETKTATIASSEEHGNACNDRYRQRVQLILRSSPKYGKEVMLKKDECGTVAAQDDGTVAVFPPPQTDRPFEGRDFKASNPEGHPNVLFIDAPDPIFDYLSKSESIAFRMKLSCRGCSADDVWFKTTGFDVSKLQ
jgi:hypothetical protein